MSSIALKTLGEHVVKVAMWNPLREAVDQEFRYIDLSSVDNQSKEIIEWQTVVGQEAPSRARQIVEAGDVLVSKVRPNLNGVARVPNELDGATASTGFCVLRTDPRKLSAEYLFQWVKSPQFVVAMVQQATGASYPAVSDRIIFASKIPLPSLSEQRRIAAILDRADELRRKRRASLSLLERLPQALFMDMFHGNDEFGQKEIKEVCDLVTDGTHYTPTYAETGIIFLSARNVTSGYIDWANVKYIPEKLHVDLQKRVAPQLGDILLAKNGTTGIAAIVDKDVIFDIYVSLALLRPGRNVLPVYLHQAVSSMHCRRQFTDALKGIGVSNLHLVDI
jgi:type I restriction enzyme S subunit